MRLTEAEILDGLGHENLFVREQMLQCLEQCAADRPDVTARVIAMVERFGWQESVCWPYRITKFQLDEPSLLWALEQLQRTDDGQPQDSTKNHLAVAIAHAPLHALRPVLERVVASLQCTNAEEDSRNLDRPTDTIHERIHLADLGADECWKRLDDHCRSVSDAETFAEANIGYAENLLEPIEKSGAEYADRVLDVLSVDEVTTQDGQDWLVGIMIILAGRLRLKQAIPLLYRRFTEDWDWYNEEIPRALVRIGSADVLEYTAAQYGDEPWYVRNYLTGAYRNLRHERAVEFITPLVEEEEDDHLRGQLGVALAGQFDSCGVAPAKAIYDEMPEDREREEIIESLFAHAHLAQIDFPERNAWGERFAEQWRQLQRSMNDPDEAINSLLKRLHTASSENGSLDELSESDRLAPQMEPGEDWDEPSWPAPVGTIRKTLSHVGRNDACPCGSGKKYKKCCMRSSE